MKRRQDFAFFGTSSSKSNHSNRNHHHQQPNILVSGPSGVHHYREIKTEPLTFDFQSDFHHHGPSPTAAASPSLPKLEVELKIKKERTDYSYDSGLGGSFHTSTGTAMMYYQEDSVSQGRGSLLETPSSSSVGSVKIFGNSLISPMGRSRCFQSPEGFQTDNSSRTESSEMMSLSKTDDVSEYRFDGQKLMSLGGKGLVKIGSPETAFLSTPKLQRRFARCLSESQPPAARPLMPRTVSAQSQPAPVTPPKFGPQTPSKLLPFSPTHDMAGPHDFLGSFVALNTSTPVRRGCLNESLSSVAASSHLVDVDDSGFVAVVPSSSVTPDKKVMRKTDSVPRTPTPFKKALAALERTSGRIDQDSMPDVQDMHEFILKDSFCERDGISSRANSEQTETEETGRSLQSDGSDQSKNSVKDSRIGDFQPPDHTPDKRSSEWMEITCGKTGSQVRLTEKAKELLGI